MINENTQPLFRGRAAPNMLQTVVYRVSGFLAMMMYIIVAAVFLVPDVSGEAATPTGRIVSLAAAAVLTYPIYHYLFRRKPIKIYPNYLVIGEDTIQWSLVKEIKITKMTLAGGRHRDKFTVSTLDGATRNFYLYTLDKNRFLDAISKLKSQNPNLNFQLNEEIFEKRQQ